MSAGKAEQPWVGVIANPGSGAGRNRERVALLEQSLAARGFEARVSWDFSMHLARGDGAHCNAWVAAGGDGTLNGVLQGSVDRPLAVLPLGTENLAARTLGFSRDPQAIARAIARGQTQWLDVGRAGSRRFLLMLTAGFDAEVIHRMDAWRRSHEVTRQIRHFHYTRPILDSLREYPYREMELIADGESVKGTLAMVFNLGAYPLGLSPFPHAQSDDGLFDWIVFQRPGAWRLAHFAWDILGRRHPDRSDVRMGRARSIQIHSDEPVPIQLDGEAAGTTPVEIQVEPETLEVIDPR